MNRVTGLLKEKPEIVLTSLMVLVAFALRYWFFWNFPYPLMLHEQDGIAYMSIARELLSFRIPSNLFMPPFYPTVIAVFSLLPVKLEIAARIAAITMDALTVIPLFGLSRIILPRTASLVVCFLWATFGFSLYYSASPLSQSTYLCMLLSGTYILYRALLDSSRTWLFGVSGVLLCAAYLTRPEGIVSLGAGILLIVSGAFRKGVDRRAHLKGGAVFLLTFMTAALPYLFMLRYNLGFWSFTGKTVVAIKGIDGSLTIGATSGKMKTGLALWLEQFGGLSGGMTFIRGNIKGFIEKLAITFPNWMNYLAVAGIPFVLTGRNFFNRLFLLVPLLVTLPVFVANLPKVHAYIYPLFPLYFISFTNALWLLSSSAGKMVRLLPGSSAVATLVCYAMLLGPLPKIALNNFRETIVTFTHPSFMHQVNMTNRLLKPIAEDLKRFSGEKDRVMTRWGLISYFAERPLVIMPKGSIEEVLSAGRQAGARFIVVDTESVETRRQELAPLLAPLFGKGIDPALGIDVVSAWSTDIGGYVLFRYR